MTVKIKLTKTQTIIYNVADQDMQYYKEEGVVNVHMAALCDVKSIEDSVFDWDDLESSADEDDTSYEVVLVEQEDGLNVREIPVDENNKERDTTLFPEGDDDEEEDADEDDDAPEHPVAGELNAGGEAYGRIV
jgi:hypothetical protein